MTNNTTLNLVTKGLLNISNITKGMILGYTIIQKKGGGGSQTPPIYKIYNDEQFINDIRKIKEEDISVINIKVDWKKTKKNQFKIEAKLLKKKIEAVLLEKTGKKIKIELI